LKVKDFNNIINTGAKKEGIAYEENDTYSSLSAGDPMIKGQSAKVRVESLKMKKPWPYSIPADQA